MLVTIALAFTNDKNTIIPAIQSIFAQTYTNWELIIVDDGARDGTLELLRMINDPRVSVHSDGRNLKVSARLNQIHAMARGKYIARMDSDDLMHPDRLRRQVEFMESNPDCDVVGTPAWRIDGNLDLIQIQGEEQLSDIKLPRTTLYVNPTIMAKREVFLKNEYDGVFVRAEDLEFWCRLYSRTDTKFGKIFDPLLFYRMDAQINLPKTLYSFRTHRKIAAIYGPELIGSFNTRLLIAELHLKSLFHRITHTLGIRELFIKRHAVLTDSPALINARKLLQEMLLIKVPGWESILNKSADELSQTAAKKFAA